MKIGREVTGWDDEDVIALRWVRVPCPGESAKEGLLGALEGDVLGALFGGALEPCTARHYVAVMGFDFAGVDRWLHISEIATKSPDGELEQAFEDEIRSLAESHIEGWKMGAAAFGIEWASLDEAQLARQAAVLNVLPREAVAELNEHGVDGMMRLRALVGRDLDVVPRALMWMGRYRDNVGGRSGTWQG